jgi:hypothetical protein
MWRTRYDLTLSRRLNAKSTISCLHISKMLLFENTCGQYFKLWYLKLKKKCIDNLAEIFHNRILICVVNFAGLAEQAEMFKARRFHKIFPGNPFICSTVTNLQPTCSTYCCVTLVLLNGGWRQHFFIYRNTRVLTHWLQKLYTIHGSGRARNGNLEVPV